MHATRPERRAIFGRIAQRVVRAGAGAIVASHEQWQQRVDCSYPTGPALGGAGVDPRGLLGIPSPIESFDEFVGLAA
jgi:hypothetical protein